MQARRFALLRRFMAAGRATFGQLVSFHKRKGKGRSTWRGKGKASAGGRALQLRQAQNRDARRGAWLRRLLVGRKKMQPPPLPRPAASRALGAPGHD
jgi:hypothetical protein